MTEYSNDFRVDDNLLLYIYCNHAVKWKKKSTINDHIYGIIYYAKKREYENKQKAIEIFCNKEQLLQPF